MNWNQRYTASKNPIRTENNGYFPAVIREGVCGSSNGYQKHLRENEIPCDACKDYRALSGRLQRLKLKQITENPDDLTVPQQFEERIDVKNKPIKRNKNSTDISDPNDPRHGTMGGVTAHYQSGIELCDACEQTRIGYIRSMEVRRRKINPNYSQEKYQKAKERYKNDPEYREKIKKYRKEWLQMKNGREVPDSESE